jgi:hypothetical protein
VLRVALSLFFVLWLAPASSLAESPERHGPPPRLERPAPHPSLSAELFRPSLAARVRLEALNLALSDLSQRERRRFLPGSLQLVLAAGFGSAAVFVHAPGLQAAFSLASAISGARGILQLAMHAGVASLAGDFAALDSDDKPSMLRKLQLGEAGLAHAARVGRRQRILEGCIGVLGSAAYVPVQFAFARRADHAHRFGSDSGDYVGLSLSLIGLASSLVQALLKTPAEQHYEQYRALRRASQQLPQ